jgi:hypothetical protein
MADIWMRIRARMRRAEDDGEETTGAADGR